MKLSILYLNLLALLGTVYSICVLDTKKGWRLDCGLRDSYLLRVKDFGGFKANFDFGFGVGDEKGFPNSISKSNKPKQINPYAHKHKKSKYRKPIKNHKKSSYRSKQITSNYQSLRPQVNSYRMPIRSYVSPHQQSYLKPTISRPLYANNQSPAHVSENNIYSSEGVQSSQSEKTHSSSHHTSLHNSHLEDQSSLHPQHVSAQHNSLHQQQHALQHQSHQTQHQPQLSSYSEIRRHDNSKRFSRRNDFPYEFYVPQRSRKPKKKKKKRMWPFNLFSWGKDDDEEENRHNSLQTQNIRRQFVQTPFFGRQQLVSQNPFVAQQQFVPQSQFTQQPQFAQQSQFAQQPQSAPQRQFVPQTQFVARPQFSPLQQNALIHPSFNNFAAQQFTQPFRPVGFHRNQRPFVFRSPNVQTTTEQSVTVGREMADILHIPSHTDADTDNVPSFAAKMFVVREAPREFYPPKYIFKSSPKKHISVQIPRTKFYCEAQSYLPGIYADTQLGCKMFHLCVPSSVGSTLTSYLCPNGTLFDQSILQCNYWYNVDCESSSNDFDANLALARSYRKINAAHLDLHGATDTNSLSLLSQNINNLSGSSASNRRGRLLESDSHDGSVSSRISNILEIIQSSESRNKSTQ